MGQHFQMTMYRGSVQFHLEGYVLTLLTCDPQGFISGAGFFQSHPKDNYQRGLTDLSACSSWRLRFLTYKQLGSQTSRTKGSEDSFPKEPPQLLTHYYPCQVYCEESHQPIDFSYFCNPLNPQMYMLYFILFIMYICLYCQYIICD